MKYYIATNILGHQRFMEFDDHGHRLRFGSYIHELLQVWCHCSSAFTVTDPELTKQYASIVEMPALQRRVYIGY